MIASLVGILASPAVRSLSETDTAGKQFLRLGALYSAVGWWLYQQGGILGYSLKGERQLLENIMSKATHLSVTDVDTYKDSVIADLTKVDGREKHLSWLYTHLEMEKIGIDHSNPEDKRLQDTIDLEGATGVMKEAFYKGVTIGFHFPAIFKEYWQNTYLELAEDELEKDPAKGSALSETQLGQAFTKATVKVINTVFNWNQLEDYEVLSREDETTLENILNGLTELPTPADLLRQLAHQAEAEE